MAADGPGWELLPANGNVSTLKFSGFQKGWEQHCLLLSDLHWDNPHCERGLLKRHLDEALERNAPVFLIGDTFCAMQGKYDKRSSKSDLRPEHKTGGYLDSLVKTAVDWLDPYKSIIAVVGEGNHETSIANRHETNLCERLVMGLRDRGGITQLGGYGGFIRFRHAGRDGHRGGFTAYYHHGFGGGGPVTQGKIDWSRYMMQVRADVYLAGHVHYKEAFPHIVGELTLGGKVRQRQIHCVRLGTYKDEWNDGRGGFHIEKGRGPRALGGYWMRCYHTPGGIKRQMIETED